METNPAYKHLAYRGAILRYMANLILQKYVGADGSTPSEIITCEHVFFHEREVPPEEIMRFVEELQAQEAEVRLEMNKFEFRREDEGSTGEPAPPKKSQSRGSKKRGRRKASGPKPEAN
jgi:hypothetical protein